MADAHHSPASIGVVGLWHLGCVTAACLAEAGNTVIGVDPDPVVIEGLRNGRPPIFEAGLSELIAQTVADGRLTFSHAAEALGHVDLAWVTFDTPVDDDDRADVEWVLSRCEELLASLPDGALVVVSSQLPVGSAAALLARCASRRANHTLRVACVPENLRLGQALEAFRQPDRIVAGVGSDEDRRELAEVLSPFSSNVQWMGLESAEMTKHALNGFLATSVAFINEVAAVCELVGADAAEVSRGLRSERRIGPRAYLAPGDAFAGGTLARDISFLRDLAREHGLSDHVFAGVAEGNVAHRRWTERKLLELLGEDVPDGARGSAPTVGIWGLTYKPGTNTLRRSSAVALCRWLIDRGVRVRAHDPQAPMLPVELAGRVRMCDDPLEAASEADVLVVSTPWPLYREIGSESLVDALRGDIVIDPAGFLADTLGSDPRLRFVRVGTPSPPGLASKGRSGRTMSRE